MFWWSITSHLKSYCIQHFSLCKGVTQCVTRVFFSRCSLSNFPSANCGGWWGNIGLVEVDEFFECVVDDMDQVKILHWSKKNLFLMQIWSNSGVAIGFFHPPTSHTSHIFRHKFDGNMETWHFWRSLLCKLARETLFKTVMLDKLDQTSLLFSVASSNRKRHAFIALCEDTVSVSAWIDSSHPRWRHAVGGVLPRPFSQ